MTIGSGEIFGLLEVIINLETLNQILLEVTGKNLVNKHGYLSR